MNQMETKVITDVTDNAKWIAQGVNDNDLAISFYCN